jgi:hypothetical protein
LEDVEGILRRARPEELERIDESGARTDLRELLDGLNESLRGIADAIAAQHFWHPSPMQPLGVVSYDGVA